MLNKTLNALQQQAIIDEIMEKVHTIVNNFDPDKIILFGCYASGNPTAGSDLDLLVILDTKKSTLEASVDISLAVSHNYPFDIIVRNSQEIKNRLSAGDFFLRDIFENGKVLYEPGLFNSKLNKAFL